MVDRGGTMRKMLIADSSRTTAEALANYFCKKYETAICTDGETALKMLGSFAPDILIVNLSLPGIDGITLLQKTVCRPGVIMAILDYPAEYAYMPLMELGVGAIMLKPFAGSAVASHLAALEAQQNMGPVSRATGYLRTLGIASHLDGYQQLRVGIPLFAQDPSQRVCKELYANIATVCGNRTTKQVERSMRSAIKTAWKRRDDAVWDQYFPETDSCPTNKAFISRLAEKLKEKDDSA